MPGKRTRRDSAGWSGTVSRLLTAFVAGIFAAMVLTFVWQSVPVWRHEGLDYLTGRRWFYRAAEFGAAPMIYGTVWVAVVALVLAAPIGLGAAVFASEFLPRGMRLAVKSAIELLAGIPSVVYGLLGILVLRNWVFEVLQPWDPIAGDTLLTAGILLAVMILPTLMTLADDAFQGISASQRAAARGLGLSRAETVLAVVLPQARQGLVAAVLLSLGRALGEMIAVFLVVGRQDNQWPETLLSLRLLIEPGQTLASKLGGSETHIAYGDGLHWGAMMGLGVILLAMTLSVTLAGHWLQRRSHHEA